MTPLFSRLFEALDERLHIAEPARHAANKIFPRHWSFLLGEVALFSFGILVVTGIFLTMFYRPSVEPTVYDGAAELFTGRSLPAAYESVIRLSNDVPAGLFVRRVHRVTATVFILSAALHLARVLLTGAFRKPREPNYHLGLALLLLAVASGYSGHNLIFDVLAGTSLRILYSFLQSVPWVGEGLAQFVFGGEFPTGDLIPRLYAVHVVVLPALIAGGVALHLWMVVKQTHVQYSPPGVDAGTHVAGEPMWPYQFATSTVLTLTVAGLVSATAALVPWSDVELHGPYIIATATNASQPDWFLFWVEGALRLYPGWEWELFGTVISGVFLVGIVLPLLVGALLFGYPLLERLVVGRDDAYHHEAQRPFDVPFRIGFVAGLTTFLAVLTTAAGHDVIARLLQAPIEAVTVVLQIAALTGPPLVGVAAARYARYRARRWP